MCGQQIQMNKTLCGERIDDFLVLLPYYLFFEIVLQVLCVYYLKKVVVVVALFYFCEMVLI